MEHTLIYYCKQIQNWIVESEMEGTLDKSDSFYPIYEGLNEVIEKLENE